MHHIALIICATYDEKQQILCSTTLPGCADWSHVQEELLGIPVATKSQWPYSSYRYPHILQIHASGRLICPPLDNHPKDIPMIILDHCGSARQNYIESISSILTDLKLW